MGLISRVSSRTYRDSQKPPKNPSLKMKSRLLRFAFRRSTENAENNTSKSFFGKMKKSYENPLPINVKGSLYRHADRYGLKTYSLKELSETGPDFLRGIAWTSMVILRVLWEVKLLKRRKCCMEDICFMEADF